MATPAFLLRPSSSEENGNDGASGENRLQPPPDPAPKDSSPARPKPRRASKAAGPKRPPQRGLGVAQLERLRLQERWKKATEVDLAHEIQPFTAQLPVYDYPAAYGIPRRRPASPGRAGYGGGGGGASAVRSVIHEQYSLDRCRMGMRGVEGRFQVGSPFPEPPSNQKMQCFSDQCEFCARKKRLFGENPGLGENNGADYFEMDLAAAIAVKQESQSFHGCGHRRGKSMTESSEVVKEFDFFPQSRSASLEHSELGNRTAGDASPSSSSGAASSRFVDLSLKLSI